MRPEPRFRAALAGFYGVEAEQVLTTAGATAANTAVMLAHLRPGDHVVCERPTYTPLPNVARLHGAQVTFVDRDPAHRWRLDPAAVAAACTQDTRLILLSSPNNPTGAVASEDDLRALGEVAEKANDRGIHVLVDQAYAPLTDAPVAGTLHQRLLTTASFNKTYGCPGLRTGWLLGDAALLEQLRRVHQWTTLAPPPWGEAVGPLLLEGAARCRADLEERLRANRATYRAWLGDHGFDDPLAAATGGLTGFPAIGADRAWCDAAAQEGLVVLPGTFFGANDAAGHVRIGLGGDPEALGPALEALAARLAGPHGHP